MEIVAQDDHVLVQELNPLIVWQKDEIVKEAYSLDINDDLPPGEYHLRLGIYSWPDQNRLIVPDNPDNIIELPSVSINR